MKSIFDFIFYPVLIGSNFVLRFNAHLINLYKICLSLFLLFCFECCGLKQTLKGQGGTNGKTEIHKTIISKLAIFEIVCSFYI